MGRDWRCTRCGKLLGLMEGDRLRTTVLRLNERGPPGNRVELKRWPTSYGDCIRTMGRKEGPCDRKPLGRLWGEGWLCGPTPPITWGGGATGGRRRVPREVVRCPPLLLDQAEL